MSELPLLSRGLAGAVLGISLVLTLWLVQQDGVAVLLTVAAVAALLMLLAETVWKRARTPADLTVVLTDAGGAVVAAPPGTLLELLAPYCVEPALDLFQMVRDAREYGARSRLFVSDRQDEALCLTVTRLEGAKRFRWNWVYVDQPDQHRSLLSRMDLPAAEVDKAGRVIWANPAAQDCLGQVVPPSLDIGESFAPQPGQDWRLLSRKDSGSHATLMFEATTARAPSVFEIDDLLSRLPIPVARISATGEIISANAITSDLIGQPIEPGMMLDSVLEGMGPPLSQRLAKLTARDGRPLTEVARIRNGVADRFVQLNLLGLRMGEDMTILMSLSDATELKTMEAQFVQSQKMQAVGQLAGGVAHDFNNLLTAISGHCDLLLMRHRVGDSDYSDLMQVRENTNRAAALVRQLLAFSRKQTLQPTQLDLWDTLGDLSHLLNRLIGANVTLDIRKGEDIPTVRVDERQFEQVVMNLVVNARDAMPDGGLITLNARGRTLVNPLRRDKVTVPAGDYALIEVKDTGQGIAPDDLRKIFEPFFTTKGPGRGTGLGLSTVYGIVKQSGGYVFVDSHLGEGTTFSLYLPAVVKTAPELVPRAPVIEPSRDVTGRGVILLVEDEVPVRTFAKRALEMRGYEVIEAGTGEDALELLKASVELHPDIVLSDVVMPGMDGPSWVREADTRLDGARVIFMSGYAEDAFDGTDHPGSAYLAKPFSLNQLVLTVKEQLERVD